MYDTKTELSKWVVVQKKSILSIRILLVHYLIIINTFSVDSGGQYADGGTTDVTRTFHYGTPSSNQVWT